MTAIRAESVGRTFGAVHALRGVSFTVEAGQRIALLGRSGSGKSTLLHLLAGLDHTTSGTLTVFGQLLQSLPSARMAEYRSRTVGMIFQAFHLIATRTALENVALPLFLAGVVRSERLRRATEALEEMGMGHRRHAFPPTLSGGESQRIAIARAIVHRPPLLLADEPTGNLDSTNAGHVMDLLLDQTRRRGTTLVLVTHDEPLASRAAERILRLRDGQLEGV